MRHLLTGFLTRLLLLRLFTLVLVEGQIGRNKRSVVDGTVVALGHKAVYAEHRLQVGAETTLRAEPVWREEGHVIQLEIDESPLR